MNTYNICMMGPSRTGKTTLLASLIHEFETITEKEYQGGFDRLSIKAAGETFGRIGSRINQIEIATLNGSFDSGCLDGTQNHEVFELSIKPNTNIIDKIVHDYKFKFHDFPGDWINDPDKIEFTGLLESEVMLLPIDSSLIMEAITIKEKEAAAMQLTIHQVKDVVKTWAKQRNKAGRGLFILAPLKCETYFKDNLALGPMQDKSLMLREKVLSNEFFGKVITVLKSEFPDIESWYMPIDTIGCCYLNRKKWTASNNPNVLQELQATYTIPNGKKWTPFGPAHIMFKLLNFWAEHEEQTSSIFGRLGKKLGVLTVLNKEVQKLQESTKSTKKYSRSVKI